MIVDSEDKSNEAIAPYITSAEPAENGADGSLDGIPVTPEMVLRLPSITDSMKYFI